MRTVAVTGAASGMGAATRERLEASGETVIGIDRNGVDVVADLSTDAGRQAAVDGVMERCGDRLDGLVLAAGLGLPNDDPAAVVSVNYFGAQALLSALRPLLAAAPAPRAVVVASNSVMTVPDIPATVVDACLDGDEELARKLAVEHGDLAAYAGSKTAIARVVRREAPKPEWAGVGIRLNAVAPGPTATPMFDRSQSDETFRMMFEMMPLPVGFVATADHLAAWIEILLGDAADFVCGQVIAVDGGQDALLRGEDWPRTYALPGG